MGHTERDVLETSGILFIHQLERLVQLPKVQRLRSLDDVDVLVEFVLEPLVVRATEVTR